MKFPRYWKNKIHVPNHQPDYVYSHIYFPQSWLWAHNGRIHTLWQSNMAIKDPYYIANLRYPAKNDKFFVGSS
jgi:hypothetical protein